jgi:hypothetical protein
MKDEKDKRFKKGQYFYCKKAGHYVDDYPIAKKKDNMQNNS